MPYIDKPKPVPIVHNVFVYGTLKKGEPNHYWLNNPENGLSKFVKRAITVAKYPLVVGQKYNTPFLLKNPGVGNHILGEVYIIDNFMLQNLDKLKGAPVYYHREIDVVRFIQSDSEGNDEVLCWIYFANADTPKNLKSIHMISNFRSRYHENETVYI